MVPVDATGPASFTIPFSQSRVLARLPGQVDIHHFPFDIHVGGSGMSQRGDT